MKRIVSYFTPFEWGLWLASMVVIVLWVIASLRDITYVSVVLCFAVFLVNDLYGFVNWRRMEKRQQKA